MLRQYLGVALIVVGALLLIVSYLAGWTNSNLILLIGLIIIIFGVTQYVRQQKSSEKY